MINNIKGLYSCTLETMASQRNFGAPVFFQRWPRLENLDLLAGTLNLLRFPFTEDTKWWASANEPFIRAAELIVTGFVAACARQEKGAALTGPVAVPHSLVTLFNKLADRPISISLSASDRPSSFGAPSGLLLPRWRDEREHLVFELFQLFWNPDALRLKQCGYDECARWFVDRSRGNVAQRCSAACTNRKWNRKARREASHIQYAKKPTKTAKEKHR